MCKGDIKTLVAGPITVVQILPELEGGGVERGTLELGSYLVRKGHRSIVISGGGRLVPPLVRQGSTHIVYRHIGEKSPRCLSYMLPLRRLLVEQKVDILHLRSRLPAWIGYLAWKSLPLPSRPRLVTTFHGFYSINTYSAIMTKGEQVIAISKVIAEHIRKHYHIIDDKISIIPRGYDESIFNPAKVRPERLEKLRINWQIPETTSPIIMLPGRLSRLKGHDVFISSLAQLTELPWQAVCVGDLSENPDHAHQLQTLLQKLNLTNRVRFVGYCEDMPAALMLADLVVSATSIEPEAFGRVAVEAQAMGKPVIATAHGGSLETIQNRKTGLLVKPNDVNSMTSALHEILTNEALRRSLGRKGPEWVRKYFTIGEMCDKTITLYYRMLDERRPHMVSEGSI